MLLRTLAAAALAAAGALVGVGLAPTPAVAAACSGASGVTVVVDPDALGGGVRAGCDPAGAGRSASQVVPAAGFPLTYVQRQPGFVCRVSGAPSSDPCVDTPPADAYWGLFWSDGRSGDWVYSSVGVGSLEVPDGGYIAFAWQSGSRTEPAYDPEPRAASPSQQPSPQPAPQPAPGGSGASGGSGSTGGGSGPGGPAPAEDPSPGATGAPGDGRDRERAERVDRDRPRRNRPGASPSASPEPTASPSAAPEVLDPDAPIGTSEAAPEEGGRLPGWVVLAVLGVMVAAVGGTALARRRG